MTQPGQMSTAVVFEDRPDIINHFGKQIKREKTHNPLRTRLLPVCSYRKLVFIFSKG